MGASVTSEDASARAIVANVAAGRCSARSVAEQVVQRIEQRNPLLNAIVTFDPDDVISQAEDVDRRRASGERLPLAGLPVAIKDNIWVKDRRVTQGSRLFHDFIAPADAIVVERLRKSGAVIAGLANTSEFACKGVTTNRLFGPTRHPLDQSLTPGGSSGGSAVAVAAGLVPLAIGTDAGGSSRRPPAHVGVVGFKPSFGAIPYGPGFAEPLHNVSVVAPIARCVDDVVLAFWALQGRDPRDRDSIAVDATGNREPRQLKIAYSPRLGLERPIDSDVSNVVALAVRKLGASGLAIEVCDPKWPPGADEQALAPLQWAGLAALYGDAWRKNPDLFDSDIARQIEAGCSTSGADVAQALSLSSEIARSLAAFFGAFDLLICPTTPCVAWPLTEPGPAQIGGVDADPRGHAVFTPFFNHAKVPAVSIPCGCDRNGLPIGLQIIGARGADRMVLQLAKFAESVLAPAAAPAWQEVQWA